MHLLFHRLLATVLILLILQNVHCTYPLEVVVSEVPPILPCMPVISLNKNSISFANSVRLLCLFIAKTGVYVEPNVDTSILHARTLGKTNSTVECSSISFLWYSRVQQ